MQSTISQPGSRVTFKASAAVFKFLFFISAAYVGSCAAGQMNLKSLEDSGSKNIAIENFNGIRNYSFLKLDGSEFKVSYPAGSYDPMSMRRNNLQYGGMNFKYKSPEIQGRRCTILQYSVKFPDEFDFVKGGKLPGIYGGEGNTGGKIPNGYDGFSVRLLWTAKGEGQIYAYLPSSKKWGSGFKKKSWLFKKGSWEKITLLVNLNDVGKNNGLIKLWVDSKNVATVENLEFRKTKTLNNDGVLFSTFFGGNNPSFAPLTEQHLYFKDIVISEHISDEMSCKDENKY